jgi:hypothetical protein
MLIAKPVSFFQSPVSPVSHAASKELILFFKDFCEWRNVTFFIIKAENSGLRIKIVS